MPPNTLQRRLHNWQLWAIAVGMVISGQYFGWNQGFLHANVLSLLVALVIVTVFYCGFMTLLTQLAIAMPRTGGVMYYLQTLGYSRLAIIAGWAAFFEYFFGVVAIAIAIGASIHGLWPFIPRLWTIGLILLLSSLLNCLRLEQSVGLEVLATLLALAGIVIFIFVSWQPNEWQRLYQQSKISNLHSVIFAIPFVLWLYLGIEGSALSTEEALNPAQQLPKVITAALGILILGAVLIVMQVSILLPASKLTANNPLPLALSYAHLNHPIWIQTVSLLGLCGLLASLNGLLIASSRQLFAMARQGWAPSILMTLNRHGMPFVGLSVLFFLALLAQECLPLSLLLRLSILGVLIVYLGGLFAWFNWRHTYETSFWLTLLLIGVTLTALFCIACIGMSLF